MKYETEVKLQLESGDFAHLLQCVRVVSRERQINIYYDCDGALSGDASTFRVRYCPGKGGELTLKVPAGQDHGARVMLEVERELASVIGNRKRLQREVEVERDLPAEFQVLLLARGVRHLKRLGWMTTIRVRAAIDGVGEVELDEVHLPNGQTFFEAEVENEDPAVRQRVVSFVRSTAPSARPSLISKFARFREALSSGKAASGGRRSAGHF